MDTAATFAAATDDPDGFVAGLPRPVVIDEAQRVPALAVAIKAAVDADRQPGRFLLTGSAGVMSLPKLSESLAGRMELHTLWPLSQGEIEGTREAFVDRLFAAELAPSAAAPLCEEEVAARMCTGGFPEARGRHTARRREAWFDAYVDSILQRDVYELANIDRLLDMPRLLGLLATRTDQLINHADLARTLALPQTTYLVLEDRQGRLVGVEVKCTATLRPQHFTGLKALQEIAGERFVRGVVVYLGTEVVPFGAALHGLPLAQVWA